MWFLALSCRQSSRSSSEELGQVPGTAQVTHENDIPCEQVDRFGSLIPAVQAGMQLPPSEDCKPAPIPCPSPCSPLTQYPIACSICPSPGLLCHRAWECQQTPGLPWPAWQARVLGPWKPAKDGVVPHSSARACSIKAPSLLGSPRAKPKQCACSTGAQKCFVAKLMLTTKPCSSPTPQQLKLG